MTTHTTTSPVSAPDTTKAAWPAYVAVVAGGALLLHAGLVIGTEDEMTDAVTVTLYLGGVLLAITAAIGAGLRRRRGLRTVTAVGLVVLLVAWVMGVGDLLTPIFEAFKDEDYVGDAGPIGLLGLLLVVLGLYGGRQA